MLALLAQVQIQDRSGGVASCVADNGFCPSWIADNLDRYVDPFVQHVFLTLASVAVGFAIAFTLALLAHRHRWLVAPIVQVTAIMYTLPSIAVFFLLLPLTGRGNLTAIVALVAYSLLIIFRNVTTGLDNVPTETRDAGRGMGLTERQLLWRVELPLALPLIFGGIKTSAVNVIATATIAPLAGVTTLGDPIINVSGYGDTGRLAAAIVVASLAVLTELLLSAAQRAATPRGLKLESDQSRRRRLPTRIGRAAST